MTDQEALQMMQHCLDEIKTQRNTITHLAPKAEAYELIHSIVGLLPKRSAGEGLDIIWTLEKRIRELKEQLKSSED